jgi:hypothetical protein
LIFRWIGGGDDICQYIFRVNRNYIIRFSDIRDILIYSSGRLKIILADHKGKDDILASRDRVAAFKAWMDR